MKLTNMTVKTPASCIFGLVLGLASTLFPGSVYADLPYIKNLTINPTPPGAKVGAAYFNLHNPNDTTMTLSKVSSPAINRIEMHFSEVVDDVAKMHKLESVEIAADETFNFSHGGHHLMLMNLEGPLFPGDLIPIVFHTDQGDITVEARVAEKITVPTDGMEKMEHRKIKRGEIKHSDMNHGETQHDDIKEHGVEHDG